MFGCPYNFYPEKPWLRRTIRGMIATGVVVASPIIVVGAVTAAVTVLPPFGIYKLIKHVRSHRHEQMPPDFAIGEPFAIEPDLDDPQALAHAAFQFDIHGNFALDDLRRVLRHRYGGLSHSQTMDEDDDEQSENEINRDFPLSIFSEMDIEHLFSDDNDDLNNSPSDFRTCPTTPASTIRKGRSQSLSHLTMNYHSSINRHHSMTTEH
jgi:hypothetical protein